MGLHHPGGEGPRPLWGGAWRGRCHTYPRRGRSQQGCRLHAPLAALLQPARALNGLPGCAEHGPAPPEPPARPEETPRPPFSGFPWSLISPAQPPVASSGMSCNILAKLKCEPPTYNQDSLAQDTPPARWKDWSLDGMAASTSGRAWWSCQGCWPRAAVHAGARPTLCCDWSTLGVTHGDPGHRAPGYRGGGGRGPVLAWPGLACGETGPGGHGRAKGQGLQQDTPGLSSVQGPHPGLSPHSPGPASQTQAPPGSGVCVSSQVRTAPPAQGCPAQGPGSPGQRGGPFQSSHCTAARAQPGLEGDSRAAGGGLP